MKAFTLIELILVVAIVFTVGTFSSVFFARFFRQSSVGLTTDKFTATLRKAQMYSVTGKRGDTWGVNYSAGTGKLTLFKGKDFASRDPAYDETFTIGSNITVADWSDVYFYRMTGTPSATLSITISSAGGGEDPQTVSVNIQGVVSR